MKKSERVKKSVLFSFVLFCGLFCSTFLGCKYDVPELEVPVLKVQLSDSAPQTSVLLSWNGSEGAQNYVIYRDSVKDSVTEEEHFCIAATSDYKKCQFVDDTCEPGIEYSYIVYVLWTGQTSLFSIGRKSEHSETVKITTEENPLVTLEYPKSVIIDESQNERNSLTVKWDAVPEADFYEIYISEYYWDYKDRNYIKVGTTTDTSFTVKHLFNRSWYYCFIKARNGEKSSNFSAVVSGYVPGAKNCTKNTALKLENSVNENFYSSADSLWFVCEPQKGEVTLSASEESFNFISMAIFSANGELLVSGLNFTADSQNQSQNQTDSSGNSVIKVAFKDCFENFTTLEKYYLRISLADSAKFSICVE